MTQYNQIKMPQYTKGRFTCLKHMQANQYNTLFSELLDWKGDSPHRLALQQRGKNYDCLIESVLRAFNMQSWTLLYARVENRRDNDNFFGGLGGGPRRR